MINGFNARCLSWPFDSLRSECADEDVRYGGDDSAATLQVTTRIPDNRLVKQAVKVQCYHGIPGNIFMDVPDGLTFDQIVERVQNRNLWRKGLPHLSKKF